MHDFLSSGTVITTTCLPLLIFSVLGGMVLCKRQISEQFVIRMTSLCTMTGFFFALTASFAVLLGLQTSTVWDLGTWYDIGDYHFHLVFVLDWISLPALLTATFLIGIVGHFSSRYLHRDNGFLRFFLIYLLFSAGMGFVILGGNLDLVFLGWELVGFSSALLIGFYQARVSPVRNGVQAFSYYRICDLGLLLAAAIWHEELQTTTFATLDHVLSNGSYIAPTFLGAALVFAAMGKSAQIPFSSWLPRAMEGPTPSSAIFYGALSVHAGAYLLIRSEPILQTSQTLPVAIVLIGITTSLYATIVGRTRHDVKSTLAYAAMAQVGLIFVEIGLGFETLALCHLIGHSLFRSWQFLRAPSFLHEYKELKLSPSGTTWLNRAIPHSLQTWAYRQALTDFHLESAISAFIIKPFFAVGRFLDRLEQRWTDRIDGSHRPYTNSPRGLPADSPTTITSYHKEQLR